MRIQIPFLFIAALSLQAHSAFAFLKFKANDSWKAVESMDYANLSIETGKSVPVSNRHVVQYNVLKVYPNGSALLEMSAEGKENKGYFLVTEEGAVYVVNTFSDPEAAAFMKEQGQTDDLLTLREAASSNTWLKSKTPIDVYKIPSGMVVTGGKTEFKEPGLGRTWEISRLEDETLYGIKCHVYESKLGGAMPMQEKTWVNRKDGYILQRKITQGGDSPVHILQVRKLEGVVQDMPKKTKVSVDPAVRQASEKGLETLEKAFREVARRWIYDVREIKRHPADEDAEYKGGAYTSRVEAVLGRKKHEDQAVKITGRINPRLAERELIGKRIRAGGHSVYIVQNEMNRTFKVIHEPWGGSVAKEAEGMPEKHVFKEDWQPVRDSKPATQTQSILFTIEYGPDMARDALTIVRSLDYSAISQDLSMR